MAILWQQAKFEPQARWHVIDDAARQEDARRMLTSAIGQQLVLTRYFNAHIPRQRIKRLSSVSFFQKRYVCTAF